MGAIKDNIGKITGIIEKKKAVLGISYKIRVVAVTKTHPAQIVRETVSAGLTEIGENRVQEAEKKFQELAADETPLSFTRHLIGHLQENKANKAAALFDFIQSVDSIETAERLDKKLKELNKIVPVLVEVNMSGDLSKFGIRPENAEDFVGRMNSLTNLKLTGLMTIGPFDKPLSETRACFKKLFDLNSRLKTVYPGAELDILSMGMSDDFEIAIEEGANMLRLGRVLFGDRT